MQSIFTQYLRSFGFLPLALISSLTLNGCQILPYNTESDAQLVVTTVKTETISSHAFELLPGQSIVGNLASINTRENDTLSDIARHFGLGYNDITLANADIDPWTPPSNKAVLLPLQFILPDAPHEGIVLNLASMRMFFYPESSAANLLTFPVGIGRSGWNTPLGQTQIIAKKANPDWTVPESIIREHLLQGDPLPSVVHPGPDNPLGNYALPLGISGYLIHGTNKPYGIGMQVSHGCIQLYPEDIKELFAKVDIGTSVRLVHQPYLASWDQGELYLEAHKPLEKWNKQFKQLQQQLHSKLEKLAVENQVTVDWEKVSSVLKRSDGIPTPILVNSPSPTEMRANAIPLEHPDQLYGQPKVTELSDSDWAVLAASFPNETDAQKLTAMLNHQGPSIPARMLAKNGEYQVIAGPFKSKQETKNVAKRIKLSFDTDVSTLPPKISGKN